MVSVDEAEIDLRGIANLLRRRIRLIALTVVATLGMAILALVAMTPVYTATGLVMVDTSRKNLLEADFAATSSSADNARVDSEVEILRSNAVLLSVIVNENLIDDPEFGVTVGSGAGIGAFLRSLLPGNNTQRVDDPLQQVLTKFSNAVRVQRRGLTYLISASVTSEDPQRAADLANALSAAYIEEQLRSKISTISSSQEIISARLEQTQQLLVASETAFDDFINANIDRMAGQEGFESVRELRNQLTQTIARNQQVTTLAGAVEASLQTRNWSDLVATLQSDAINSLNEQRAALARQLADTDSGSIAAIDLREQLEQLEASMSLQAGSELAALRAELPTLQTQADSLRRELRSGLMDSNLPVDILTQLYALQQSSELVRAQYQTLLARNSDLQVQADLQVADSRIVAPALAPMAPSFPNPRLILLLAGLAGLGLGVGLAFVYEHYLGGFTSEDQVGSVLKVPVLAEIPRQKGLDQTDGHSVADMLVDAPLSIYSEAVRRIRSGIDNAVRRRGTAQEGKGIVIMISSTSPGEGKSTISLSLTRAYALSGKRTILIDADMRKPSLHRHIGLQPGTGLAETLLGTSPEKQMAVRDPKTTAMLLLGSRSSDIPTDQLVMSDDFSRLVDACRSSFDVTIIDTPPIGPVVDGTHVAPYADAILFVTRWSATNQSEAKRAVSRLVEACDYPPVILSILNQQEGFSSRYYNKRYGGYYTA
nr:Wzz/FepE/Etk N-terminal domain-containing protein [Devosia sp. MC521]